MPAKIFVVITLFVMTVFTVLSVQAAEDDFYRGKRVHFIVMTAPGGGYDTYARAIARHLGKHIPGNPSIIVQNMPGAGGLIATHHVFTRPSPMA